MNSQTWNDNAKKKRRELISLPLAFIAGAVILLPSLSGIIQPPHIAKWALFLFLCSALLAFMFLCIALYLTFTASEKPPHISHGLGTISSTVSFIFISIYLSSNIYSGIDSSPIIEDITFTPLNPMRGTTIRLKGLAKDKDKDRLEYTWTIGEKVISGNSYAHYFINTEAKCIQATLKVEDSSENITEKTINIYLSK